MKFSSPPSNVCQRAAGSASGLVRFAFALVSLLAPASVSLGQAPPLVLGMDVWYVAATTIYRVDRTTGALLSTLPVPPGVNAGGLAVTGTPGGGPTLLLLDSTTSLIWRLDSVTGNTLSVIPAPSAASIGIGAACIVPTNVEEVFVIANDVVNGIPGSVYWINPATGGVIYHCSVNATDLRDAAAFANGNNGTGLCILRDLSPGGTEMIRIDKLSCQRATFTYAWEGWGLGNWTNGTTAGTATELYASDLGADVLHVLNATTGAHLRTIPTQISGASIRGVGGDSTCDPVVNNQDQSFYSTVHVAHAQGSPCEGIVNAIAIGVFDHPVIDLNGTILYRGQFSGGGAVTNLDDRAYFMGRTSEDLRMVVRSGQADPTGLLGPGTTLQASATLGGLGASPRISPTGGLIMFGASLFGPTIVATGNGATGNNASALIVGQPGNLTVMARRGDPYPGTGGSFLDSSFSGVSHQASCLISTGAGTFQVALAGGDVSGGSNNAAWLTGFPGNLSVVQRKGDTVNLSTGTHVVSALGFNCPTNGAGQVLHDETLSTSVGTPPASATANSCVFVYTPGSGNALLVREGDVAPGCGGALYGNAAGNSPPTLAQGFGSGGQAGWVSTLTGPGVIAGVDDRAAFVGSPSGSFLVARTGSGHPSLAAGETLGTISTLSAYSDFEGGSLAFYGTIAGPTVTAYNDTCLWIGRAGNLRLIVREGDLAPGFGSTAGLISAVIGDTTLFTGGSGGIGNGSSLVALNDRGQIQLFDVKVTVTSGAGASIHTCAYCWDPATGLKLLLDGGGPPTVPGDVFSTPAGPRTAIGAGVVQFPSGDGSPQSMNNDGDIVSRVFFLQGGSAIVRSKLGAFVCGPSALSATLGGVHTMRIDAGPANAGRIYAVIASASGTRPGFSLGGPSIPLNPDWLTSESIGGLTFFPGIPWGQTLGLLDFVGRATATFTMPPALPQFAGTDIDHAMVIVDLGLNVLFTSPPCGVLLH